MRALLQARALEASHPGQPAVLQEASLVIRPGRRLALMGANGSGKTTLLRCLSGAHRPDRGEVLLDGVALRHRARDLAAHRRRVQLVLQNPDDQLFSADVRADVSFGPLNLGLDEAATAARVEEALRLVGMSDRADRPVHGLSFGERKRVALAGAVAMRPEVLLLDEPTAGLDPAACDELLAAVERLEAHGTTVVLSTHDVDLAWAWAHEAALMGQGRVRQGPCEEVLADLPALRAARLRPPVLVQIWQGLEAGADGVGGAAAVGCTAGGSTAVGSMAVGSTAMPLPRTPAQLVAALRARPGPPAAPRGAPGHSAPGPGRPQRST